VLAPADCDCGPDFCLNDPRYPPKLAAKKKELRDHGFSSDLIALMDLDGACVACIDRAPDGFTIKLVNPDGSWRTIPWTEQDDTLARKEVLNGTLKAFYKYNVSRAFSCCGQPKFDARPDWDASLELNLKVSIACTKASGAVQCKSGR